MIAAHDVLIFTAACVLMVLTPGPNMIYLISRSICQARSRGDVFGGGGGGFLCSHARRCGRADGCVFGCADGL